MQPCYNKNNVSPLIVSSENRKVTANKNDINNSDSETELADSSEHETLLTDMIKLLLSVMKNWHFMEETRQCFSVLNWFPVIYFH